MKLICYPLNYIKNEMRPAPTNRDWMDRTTQKFAYRCLPLTMANAYGWEILCAASFEACWDGGAGTEAVRFDWGGGNPIAASHFGYGILSFYPGHLFRTEAGYDLFVTGPLNRPKAGISPLAGVVETDWSPYNFTMNWQFTAANRWVRFEKGEPFCTFFPVSRGLLERFDPEIRDLEDDPALKEQYMRWFEEREKVLGSEEADGRWNKHYNQGRFPDGHKTASDHRTKQNLKPFQKNK